MALPQSSCARVPDDAFAFRLRWGAFEDATGLAPGQPHPQPAYRHLMMLRSKTRVMRLRYVGARTPV